MHTLSRILISASLVFVLTAFATAQAPTDNPLATQYGDSAYPWANQIKWNSIFDITSYGGVADGVTDNVAAFNAARDAANAAGGGVVYFPAGTYYFADSINLKDGVVIRGANPTGVTSGKTAGYAPASKLVFPQYVPTLSGSGTANSTAFKQIRTTSPYSDSNIGLVNVDINRAVVNFGTVGDTYGGDTSLASRSKNFVIYGIRSNNAAIPDANVPNTKQNAWQRFDYRFAANVVVEPWRNAVVLNSRLNDAPTDTYNQPGYKLDAGTTLPGTWSGGFVLFNYTDHYGILAGRSGAIPGIPSNNTPELAPMLYRPGITIGDNYVLTTSRVKVQAAGYGLHIDNNILTDTNSVPYFGQSPKTTWVDPTGHKAASGAQTFENRGIDFTGWDVTINGNDITPYRAYIGTTGTYVAYSVDGEGILQQESGSGLVNGVTISNNTVRSYIGLFKSKEIRDVLIENNTCTRNYYSDIYGHIYVRSDTNGGPFPMYNVVIRNNSAVAIEAIAGQYSSSSDGNSVTGNTPSEATGAITYTTPNVAVSGNTGFTLNTPTAAVQVNHTPIIAITSPTWLSAAGSNVNMTASASDPDGTVTSVSFYDQTTLIGTDSNGTDGWSLPYNSLTYGAEYMISAKATDNSGGVYVSDPVYFKAVLGGDCNLDRYVDVIDLGVLATNYGKTVGGQWNIGDFNEDGKIDVIDLGILATKYGQGPGSADVLPEPATLSLLCVGVAGLLRRK